MHGHLWRGRGCGPMIRMPKKVLFAIETVLDIAYHAGEEPVQSVVITRRQGIPRRYLEQVLQQLVRAGVLTGTRGPRGGYRLARERRRISIGQIVRVVQGLDPDDQPDDLPAGSELGQRVVRPLCTSLQEEFMTRLDGITLDDLCRQAQVAGIRRGGQPAVDFSI